MCIYKKLLLMSMLGLMLTGCGDNDTSKKEVSVVEDVMMQNDEREDMVQDTTAEIKEEIAGDKSEEMHEEDSNTQYIHDAGYSALIHEGFAIKFQVLMETIYSCVNYSLMGTAVEDITPMDEDVMIQVEEMMRTLNPVQDEEIVEIVKKARELFNEVNAIIAEKKYELLNNFDERGQALYNEYYEWLIEAAEHHTHEH